LAVSEYFLYIKDSLWIFVIWALLIVVLRVSYFIMKGPR